MPTILDTIGAQMCTISYGKEASFAGKLANVTIQVTPMAAGIGPIRLVWAATGDIFSPFTDSTSGDTGAPGIIALPRTDQDGFRHGSIGFKNWYYKAAVTATLADGQQLSRTYQFQAASPTLDLDLLDEDGVVAALPVLAPISYVHYDGANLTQDGTIVPISGGGGSSDYNALTNKPDIAGQIAAAVAALTDGAPGALNTLNELAAALNDDASYAATVTTALAARYTKTETDARYAIRNTTGIDVRAYGAVGDGTTDDTTAINAAVTAWLAFLNSGGNATLHFAPNAVYKTTSRITITPGGTLLPIGGTIEGHGATLKLVSGVDTVALVVDNHGTGKGWQRGTIRGLTITGGGLWLRAGGNTEFLYDWTVDNVHVLGKGLTPPLRLSGVFESQVQNSFFEFDPYGTPTTDAQSCILIEKETNGAQPSSNDLINVTTRGGYRGIRSGQGGDVRIQGGTVLAAQQEGIYLQGVGHRVEGVHMEGNWLSATTTDTERAEVRIDGSAYIAAVFVINSTASSHAPYSGSTTSNYAVRSYVYGVTVDGSTAPGLTNVHGVVLQSNVPGAKVLKSAAGSAGSSLIASGIASYDVTPITGGKTAFLDEVAGADPSLFARYVVNGSSTSTARPSGAGMVIWVGSVTPANMADGDIRISTS